MKLSCWLFLLTSVKLIRNSQCILDCILGISPSDVTLYAYNKTNINQPQVVFSLNDVTPYYQHFNVSKELFLVAHGWLKADNSDFAVALKNAVFSTQDINFIEIVWLANTDLICAAQNMVRAGEYVGIKFITHICEHFNYPYSNVKFAGHSFGAHLAGIAGKNANGTIKSIVGCDPPDTSIFNLGLNNGRQLAAGQAGNVQVIHTTSDTTGIKNSIGDSDFWPNGGGSQPGCNFINNTFASCSHDRSFKLLAESIISPLSFIAVPYDTKSRTTYNTSQRVYMGGYNLDPNAKCDYYLETSSQSPYGLGTSWLK